MRFRRPHENFGCHGTSLARSNGAVCVVAHLAALSETYEPPPTQASLSTSCGNWCLDPASPSPPLFTDRPCRGDMPACRNPRERVPAVDRPQSCHWPPPASARLWADVIVRAQAVARASRGSVTFEPVAHWGDDIRRPRQRPVPIALGGVPPSRVRPAATRRCRSVRGLGDRYRILRAKCDRA